MAQEGLRERRFTPARMQLGLQRLLDPGRLFGTDQRRQTRGRPNTRWAMMLRWISDVPPEMVPAKLPA
jgi:hypothetical protein